MQASAIHLCHEMNLASFNHTQLATTITGRAQSLPYCISQEQDGLAQQLMHQVMLASTDVASWLSAFAAVGSRDVATANQQTLYAIKTNTRRK